MLRVPLTASRGSCNTANRATLGPAAEPGANGRHTVCAMDSSAGELYHGSLGHEGTQRHTERIVARILPRTAERSGVGGNGATPPGNPTSGIAHLSPTHSRRAGRKITLELRNATGH